MAPPSEPPIINVLFVDGVTIEAAAEGVIRLMGWQNAEGERRVAVRFVVTDWEARKLVAQLQGTFGPQH